MTFRNRQELAKHLTGQGDEAQTVVNWHLPLSDGAQRLNHSFRDERLRFQAQYLV